MEYASVTTQLQVEDLVAFSKFVAKGRRKKWRAVLPLSIAIGAFAVSFFLSSRRAPSTGSSVEPIIFGVMLSSVFILLLAKFWVGRRMRSENAWKENNPSLFLPNLYQVLDEGLFVENDRVHLLTRWTAIVRVAESAKYFYVMETQIRGHILPKRCFSDPQAAANFADQVRLQMEKHAAAPKVAA